MLPDKNDLAIYIHIPFCISKCRYCDFVSAPGTEREMDEYTDALCKEIEASKNIYNGFRVVSVFFGGGTPSILSKENFEKIVKTLEEAFNLKRLYKDKGPFSLGGKTKGGLGYYFSGKSDLKNQVEFTVECNPDTVDTEKFKKYKKLGVNRISFGLQSNNDKELRLLGRTYTARDFSDAYFSARDAGFENVNIDLIQAIPGQTLVEFMKNLYTVMMLGPEHVSVYSLIVEDGTPLKTRTTEFGDGKRIYKADDGIEFPYPSEEEDRGMYRSASGFLESAGLHRYEISNFAKPGMECRHNKMYWQRGNYVGYGAAAASMVNNTRWKNTEDVRKYVEACLAAEKLNENKNDIRPAYDDIDSSEKAKDFLENIREEKEKLSVNDQMSEFMFLGLRLSQGIAKEEFLEEFGVDFDFKYGEITRRFIEEGLMEVKEFEFYDPVKKCDYTKTRIYLTEKGVDVSNTIMAEYMLDE